MSFQLYSCQGMRTHNTHLMYYKDKGKRRSCT